MRMTNDLLVDMVRNFHAWEGYHLQPDERVLEALRHVDRKAFLPERAITLESVDGRFKDLAHQAFKESKTNDYPINPQIFQESLFQILSSQTFYVTIKDLAYNNVALPIDESGQTCSQPFTVALFSQLLNLQPEMKVLEVGLGCGYHAAVTANLIGNNGEIVTVERDEALLKIGRNNLAQFLQDSRLQTDVHYAHVDGMEGYKNLRGYDRIYFTARAEGVFDVEPVLAQLNPNGRLLLPSTEEGYNGPLLIYDEKDGKHELTEFGNFSFVPLTAGVR